MSGSRGAAGVFVDETVWGAKTRVSSLTSVFVPRGSAVRFPEIGSHVAIGDAFVTSSEHPRRTHEQPPDEEADGGLDTHKLECRSRPLPRRESAGHRQYRV